MNLAQPMIERLAVASERSILAILSNENQVRTSWSCDRLGAEAAAWASRLGTAGLRPGDRVALAAGRDAVFVAIHLAALATGLAIVPVNTSLSAAEASALLVDCGARLVVTSAAFAAAHKKTAAALAAPWWVADGSPGRVYAPFVEPPPVRTPGDPAATGTSDWSDTFSAVERAADDDALVLYTSGTTGKPKSVPLSHGNSLSNLEALARVWERADSDRLLHLLPIHHFHGLVLALYGSLVAGNEIVMMPAFDARRALDAIRELSITLVMGVPTMYGRMLTAAEPDDDLSGLRLAISGSAPLGVTLWERFRDRFGVALIERYGLTETGIVASNPIDAPRGGSVGRPLPGVRVAIRTEGGYVAPEADRRGEDGTRTPTATRSDHGHGGRDRRAGSMDTNRVAEGAPTSADEPRGEICVAGPNVMRGYGNDAKATAAALHDGYFHTGDLGYFDEDGYLWIDGRIKELIIVGGSNVVPGEVERVLAGVRGVAELAVAGIPDDDLGEIVAAYVVAEAGERGVVPASEGARAGSQYTSDANGDAGELQALEQSLRAAAEAGLAPYKRPRRYLFLSELPRNAMGKIDRGRLRG